MWRCFLAVVCVVACFGASPPAAAQEPQVYFGNLHSHTAYSDGSGTPEQAYTHARAAGLDFLAVTDHNHKDAESGASPDRKDGLLIGKNHSLYEGPQDSAVIPAAQRSNDDGHFVALYGQEFSSISKGNHVNVFDVDKVIDVKNGEFGDLLSWMAQHKDSTGQTAILQINHPGLNEDDPDRNLEYGRDDFADDAEWVKKMGQHACLIEVLNGPAQVKGSGFRAAEVKEEDYRLYLSLGFRLAPAGDQDNHYETWGSVTDARTAVIANGLTRQELLGAMRARHVYATEDKNLKLIFKVNGHVCGDVVAPPPANEELKIEYRVADADEDSADYRITVFSGTVGGGLPTSVTTVTREGNMPAGQWETIEDFKYTGGRQYFYFRVTQFGEHEPDRAWTAPVGFDAQGGGTPDGGGGDEVSKFVASKKSGVYHVSDQCKAAKQIKASNLVRGEEARKCRTKHQGCPQL
jgi:hypothetical protein